MNKFLCHKRNQSAAAVRDFAALLLGMVAALVTLPVSADDTDIYFASGSSTGGGAPLVMLSLDYRPNLANNLCTAGADCEAQLSKEIADFINVPDGDAVTTFDALRAVYAAVFEDLEGVSVGMMLNHDNTCTGKTTAGPLLTGCSNGGYILSGYQAFEANDANGAKAALLKKMQGMPIPQGNVGHSFQGKELYFELFRYLTGGEIYNGHLGYEDYGDTNSSTNLDVDFPLASWDTTIESGANYIDPLTNVDSCSKLTAINLLFQVSNQEDDSDDAIQASQANGGIGIGGNKITYPDVIRAMNQFNFSSDVNAEQALTSYFISTNTNTTTNGYATAGGTSSAIDWAADAAGLQKLKATLSDIFNEILAVSGTFVSAAVPVNVFNRAQIDNNIFIALFSVDQLGRPFWPGNLKKLEISETVDINGDSFFDLIDANGASAIDPNSGRIKYNALTFWTDPSTLPAKPATPTDEETNIVDGKDGRFVKRGGAGQNIPGFVQADGSPGTINLTNAAGDRKLYTQDSLGNLIAFDATATNALAWMGELGVADATEALEILTWARGNDPATGTAREWVLGDILHSKPIPINYGGRSGFSAANPDIRILMGTNDGFIHMFENTGSGGGQSGAENWAFMPRELFPNLKYLKDNLAMTPPHPYGVDGATTVYTNDANGDNSLSTTEDVWAFFGMRRGSNSMYALDISNASSPSLMWSITGGSGDFDELALSFSKPALIEIQYGSSSRPALIFGGGYNGGWDLTTLTRLGKDAGSASDTPDNGNAIFIVDAETGALIWKATYGAALSSGATEFQHPDLIDSIPSEVATLDSDGDGLDDRAYVGDSGGGVWRIDFPSATTDNRSTQWQVTKLASLDGGGASDDRRFFHKPDVVQAESGGSYFDAVLIGSGNRAEPGGTSVQDEFYMIKDTYTRSRPPVSASTVSRSDLGDITNTCLSEAGTCSADLTYGWRLQLEVPGEKVLSSPITIFGSVFFTTYIPQGSSSATCEPNEGTGRLYAVSLYNGAAAFNRKILDDGGNTTASTKEDRYETLDSSGIPSDVVALTPTHILRPDLKIEETGASAYWKTYWYEKGGD